MSEFKTGMKFRNGAMDLELLAITEGNDTNTALLLCLNDGLCITVRHLQKWNGSYCWLYGHYFENKQEALADYEQWKPDM